MLSAARNDNPAAEPKPGDSFRVPTSALIVCPEPQPYLARLRVEFSEVQLTAVATINAAGALGEYVAVGPGPLTYSAR